MKACCRKRLRVGLAGDPREHQIRTEVAVDHATELLREVRRTPIDACSLNLRRLSNLQHVLAIAGENRLVGMRAGANVPHMNQLREKLDGIRRETEAFYRRFENACLKGR